MASDIMVVQRSRSSRGGRASSDALAEHVMQRCGWLPIALGTATLIAGPGSRGAPCRSTSHGAWTLIETGKVRGWRLAFWPSLQTDIESAGVQWVDEEAVVDGNLVSRRKPDDVPAVNREMSALFARMLGKQAPLAATA